MVTFTIPGKPFGKQRARIGLIAGRPRMFTQAETVSFERQVGQIAAPLFPRPFDGPVNLTVKAVFPIPASWSKKKQAAMQAQPHTQKPDLDNCLKAIKDGLNRIAWADDSQVARITCWKVWGEQAATIVEVLPLRTTVTA